MYEPNFHHSPLPISIFYCTEGWRVGWGGGTSEGVNQPFVKGTKVLHIIATDKDSAAATGNNDY